MHAILNGDEKTGISIVRIEPKQCVLLTAFYFFNHLQFTVYIFFSFDIGDILAINECSIGKEEFQPSLLAKLANIGSNLLIQVLKNLDEYESNIQIQSSDGITYGM